MQSSVSTQAFERKISQVYDAIEVGDFKSAMRKVNTLLEKSGKKLNSTEKLYYQVVKAYVLDKMNKKQEAKLQIQDSIKEILDNNITESHLIDQTEALMVEMGLFDLVLDLIQNLQKKNLKEEQLAMKLFNAYSQQNEFQKMSGMCSFIEKQFAHKEYGLYSIQALYLYSQQKGVPPNTIDLVIMFLEKQRIALYGAGDKTPPQFFVQLYYKIMMAKGNYDKAIEYLSQNKSAFGMVLEQRRLVVKALYKKGDLVGCVNEMISIIRDNQNNIETYYSLYDIHELMISLLVRISKEKGLKVDGAFICNELDSHPIPAQDQLFQLINEGDLAGSIKNLYASFKQYESHELENKTTNHHNSRKNCILSQLLIKHKLLILLSNEATVKQFYDEKKLPNPFTQKILLYASRYIELASMIFDLYPFIPYLNKDDKLSIVQQLQTQVQGEQDPIRKARGEIGIHKVKKTFQLYTFVDDVHKSIEVVKILHQDYFRFLELDGKPEKGERKLADDLAILIDSILDTHFNEKLDSLVLYRITLLEHALELSPYNFDIQMQLVKIYDSLGLSISFHQNYSGLGCKGVQLESMGFLVLRHTIDWGDYNSFKSFMQKYRKYCSKNFSDLKQLKVRSLKEDNYEAIENFIEYEKFNQNSYFSFACKFFTNLIEFTDSNFQEHSKSYFENMQPTILQENRLLLNEDVRDFKERTQDLKIILDNYQSIDHFYDFKKVEPQWTQDFSKDQYLNEITKGDKFYSYFKFDRKTNYKSNLVNSLGSFEHFSTFAILSSLLRVISYFKNGMKEEVREEVVKLRIQYEIYEKTKNEQDYAWRLDSKDWAEQIKELSIIYQLLITQLELSSQFLLIAQTTQGKTEEIEKDLDSIKQKVETLVQEFKVYFLKFQSSHSNEESKKSDELIHKHATDRSKTRCLVNLIFGAFYPMILEIFNDSFKVLAPQKKKKKGKQQQESHQVLTELTNLIKGWQKETYQFFQQTTDVEISNYEELRKKELQEEQLKLQAMGIIQKEQEEQMEKIMVRKMEESIKEEKLMRERTREQSVAIGKKLKELSLS